MSTEAFVGEVQSVVLERWVGVSWRTTCMWTLWNSQPTKFLAESKKTYGFTCQNYFKKTCLDEEMQPVALEKNWFKYREASYKYLYFGNLRVSNFSRNDEKRKYGKRIILYEITIVDWDFDVRNLDSCFEGNCNIFQFIANFAGQVSTDRKHSHFLEIK